MSARHRLHHQPQHARLIYMEYAENRKKLDGGLYVLTAYDEMQMQNDMSASFRQEANFFYLTGIQYPGWKVIIDTTRGHTILVAPRRSEIQMIFDGGLSPERALTVSCADEVIGEDEFEERLRLIARKHSMVYSLTENTDHSFVINPAQKKLKAILDRIFNAVSPCDKDLAKARAIKQPYELKNITVAVKLSIAAFTSVKSLMSTFRYEHEIEAEFTYAFRKNGAKHAYEPIIAGGMNACTLHYVNNDSRISKRSVVLMDVGAFYDGYSADITRSYAFGVPTARQARVHRAVESAKNAIVDLIVPGKSIKEYVREANKIIGQEIASLGLISDADDVEGVRFYCPHAISHGLGLDVHEGLGGYETFQPGMVLAVEPGVYIPDESLGIRLEDDILVTESGHTNLSRNLSTEIA